MSNEILVAQQPDELLNFHMTSRNFDEIKLNHIDDGKIFKITLTNLTNQLEFKYDFSDQWIPVGRWQLRYSRKKYRQDIKKMKANMKNIKKKNAYFYYKVSNSEYINWFDAISPFKSHEGEEWKVDLKHHLYITNTDVLEVLSVVKPEIVVKEID